MTIRRNLTKSLASNGLHTAGAGGEALAVKTNNATGWFSCTQAGDGVPEALSSSPEVSMARVPIEMSVIGTHSPESINVTNVAVDGLSKLSRPTVVSCASGARASALSWTMLGRTMQLNGTEVVMRGNANNEPWVKKPPLVSWVRASLSNSSKIRVRQLFEKVSSTFTYILWCPITMDAIIVDPVDCCVDRDIKLITELKLNVVYGVNTHAHADHITGTGILKSKISNMKSVISLASGAKADETVENFDQICFGNSYVTVVNTPGHTSGCVCLVSSDEAFVLSGDTLLIRGCGRTDFQEGSSAVLFDSVRNKLFCNLADDVVVYPAHNYGGHLCSTIAEEKEYNPRLGLGKTVEEFTAIMEGLNLSHPKMIDVAVPANLNCGFQDA